MRAKFVNEFERGVDPKHALGIGRVAKIRKWARDIGFTDDMYEITANEVIFNGGLDLEDKNVTWLPDNLKIDGYLDLKGTKIKELPKGLKVNYMLWLSDTKVTKLPDDIQVSENIYVNLNQTELIDSIRDSRFSNILIIW